MMGLIAGLALGGLAGWFFGYQRGWRDRRDGKLSDWAADLRDEEKGDDPDA